MRIQIKGADLDTAAKWAARLAPTNPSVPVMAGARLVATDGQLQVSATNGDTFGTLTVPVEATTEGEIIVSARLLHTITATIPKAKDVTMERGDRGLSVRCGTRWTLPELPGADLWATWPDLGDLIGEIPADVLSHTVSRVLPAVDPDSETQILRGVAVETGELLTLAGTDRYRIAAADAEWKPSGGVDQQQLIVPADLLKTVTDSMNGNGNAVQVYTDGAMIGVVSPPHQVIGRLLAGSYPGWRSIFALPESKAATMVAVDVADLSLAVTQAAAVAKTGFDLLRLTVTPEGIEVSLHADDTDAESSAIESQHWSGEPITVGVTPRYLLAALSCLGSPMVVMTFMGGSSSKPFMLRPATKDGTVIADGYGHVLVTRKLPDTGAAS